MNETEKLGLDFSDWEKWGRFLATQVKPSELEHIARLKATNQEAQRTTGILASNEQKLQQLKKARAEAYDTATIKRYNKEIEETERKIQSLTSNQTSALGKLGQAFKDALPIASVSAVVLGMVALERQVIQTTAKFETLEAILANTLGSKGAAAVAFQQIRDFASKTPFQVDQITESYIKLANRGVRPTESQLTSLGDVASALGKDFGIVTEAILDINNTERWNEIGIKATTMGDKVRFSFKGQTVEVERTEAGVLKAVEAFGKFQGVSGTMAVVSEQLTGKLSNLSDNLDSLYNQLGRSQSGAVKSSVDLLNQLVQTITRGLKSDSQIAEEGVLSFAAKKLGEDSESIKRAVERAKIEADDAGVKIKEIQAKLSSPELTSVADAKTGLGGLLPNFGSDKGAVVDQLRAEMAELEGFRSGNLKSIEAYNSELINREKSALAARGKISADALKAEEDLLKKLRQLREQNNISTFDDEFEKQRLRAVVSTQLEIEEVERSKGSARTKAAVRLALEEKLANDILEINKKAGMAMLAAERQADELYVTQRLIMGELSEEQYQRELERIRLEGLLNEREELQQQGESLVAIDQKIADERLKQKKSSDDRLAAAERQSFNVRQAVLGVGGAGDQLRAIEERYQFEVKQAKGANDLIVAAELKRAEAVRALREETAKTEYNPNSFTSIRQYYSKLRAIAVDYYKDIAKVAKETGLTEVQIAEQKANKLRKIDQDEKRDRILNIKQYIQYAQEAYSVISQFALTLANNEREANLRALDEERAAIEERERLRIEQADRLEKQSDKLPPAQARRLKQQAKDLREYNKTEQKSKEDIEKRKAEIELEFRRKKQQWDIGAAIINTAISITAAIAAGPPASFFLVPLYAALGALQIATITAQKFFKGKIDIEGPGTETSDSIPAWLSKGESVVHAEGTRRNKGILEAINSNDEKAFIAAALPRVSRSLIPTLKDTLGPSINPTLIVKGLDYSEHSDRIDYNKLATAIASKMSGIQQPIVNVMADDQGFTTFIEEQGRRRRYIERKGNL